jgi:hypothetical protein
MGLVPIPLFYFIYGKRNKISSQYGGIDVRYYFVI